MGTKMGPNYANLFVDYVEEQIFNQFNGPRPELFGRYIDDCLGATSCTKEELERFIGFVNSFHPALKFTWEISETSVTFLEINISVRDNKLATSVHYKPTDSHSYLLYSSSNPSHVEDSIPHSQFLRLCRLCSEDSDFNSKRDEMSNFFSERGYPDNILSKALTCVQNVNRESALEPSASDNEERIPFTLTFHLNNLAARNVVLRNFKILQSDPETAPIFPNPPLVSFKRDGNLRNSLVRSSLPSNLEPGTFNYSRKVQGPRSDFVIGGTSEREARAFARGVRGMPPVKFWNLGLLQWLKMQPNLSVVTKCVWFLYSIIIICLQNLYQLENQNLHWSCLWTGPLHV